MHLPNHHCKVACSTSRPSLVVARAPIRGKGWSPVFRGVVRESISSRGEIRGSSSVVDDGNGVENGGKIQIVKWDWVDEQGVSQFVIAGMEMEYGRRAKRMSAKTMSID